MNKIHIVSILLILVLGIIMFAGGVWGIFFTYKNVQKENIVTPKDATIPNTKVGGPLSLYSQTKIIREHTLKITGGKTYAEMPQQVPKLDQDGNTVLNDKGEVIMIANDARNIWITATTLITALNLGIMAYAFSILIFILGIIFILNSIVLFGLKK